MPKQKIILTCVNTKTGTEYPDKEFWDWAEVDHYLATYQDVTSYMVTFVIID
jgi:hypothetical protein